MSRILCAYASAPQLGREGKRVWTEFAPACVPQESGHRDVSSLCQQFQGAKGSQLIRDMWDISGTC